MKPLFILVSLLFPVLCAANQCPNFSGDYQAIGLELSSQKVSIEQNACLEIVMHFESHTSDGSVSTRTEKIIVDNVKREESPNYFVSYEFTADESGPAGDENLG